MRPGEFNYGKAWHELARPAYESLPDDVKKTYELMQKEYVLRQEKSLDVSWPDPEMDGHNLRQRFEYLDSSMLARASRTVYCYGHWNPFGHDKTGSYWKFANLADQILRERLGLGREPDFEPIGFSIHQGALRLHGSDNNSWIWEDVCIADPVSLANCRAQLVEGDYDASLRAIRKIYPAGEEKFDLLDTKRFIAKTQAEIDIDNNLIGSGMGRYNIVNCNYDPHPFTIGPKHLENSRSMTLDPDCAPCARKGCKLSRSEHKSDRVLLIVGFEETDEQKEILKGLAEILETHGIDGIAFIAEEEG